MAAAACITPQERVFYPVGGNHPPERMSVLTEIFHRVLTPLYGDQTKALGQIATGIDRRCFLLYEGMHPVGVLQFKITPTEEYAHLGARKSMEIKTLFVDPKTGPQRKGLGTALWDKFLLELASMQTYFTNIHVTVSEEKPESIAFFTKKGFSAIHSWQDRYQKDKKEWLLSCPKENVVNAPAYLEGLPKTPIIPDCGKTTPKTELEAILPVSTRTRQAIQKSLSPPREFACKKK